ncbi:MAG: recombinase family protein [Acidimicrobiales bacterium]
MTKTVLTTANAPPVRCAIYTRLSKETDDLWCPRQEADLRKLCTDRGWAVAAVYCDPDRSAADPKITREAYQQLLVDIRAGKFDAVAVYDSDRLHRMNRELEDFVVVCEAAGVTKLGSVTGDIDLNNPDALMLLRFKVTINAAEVEKTRRRVLRKQREIADNVIPVALGGSNNAENLQILCGPCNRRKGAGLSTQ